MSKSIDILRENLIYTIFARHPVVGVISEDEREVLHLVKEKDFLKSIGEHFIFIYDIVKGLEITNEKIPSDYAPIKEEIENLDRDLLSALEYIDHLSQEIPIIFIIKSADTTLVDTLDKPEQLRIFRYIKNLANKVKEGYIALTTILLMERMEPFPLIEKDIVIYELSFPNREEIAKIIEQFLQENQLYISDQLNNSFISALQGLTRTEIDNLLYLAFSNDASLDEKDIDFIFNYKKQVVSKRGILEFIDLKKLPDDIGGLKNLKNWLKRKKSVFDNLDEAIKNGVSIPKGVLLFGMPGCGKSMTAKYAAKLLKLPLLRLDMGKIMGPYLGQSEENMRKAILLAENISPSILWIDEIEKALSGVKGAQGNDTLIRIFGTLLTWMQEKDKPVFVIATANDISILPPEFLRKGRFDEIFFVDFPSKEDMEEIFRIHLQRAKQEIEAIDLDSVIKKLDTGYSGADIEAIVDETVERVFVEKKEKITTSDLLQTIEKEVIVSTKKLLGDSIDQLREKIKSLYVKKAN